MSTLWKVLLGLVLALPLAAFVAGAVLASSADEPAPRETIVIQDAPSGPDDDGTRSGPGRSNDESRPGQQPSGSGDDDSDDDEVEVVRPEPDTVDDDNSGPGGDDADDNNSGPGGGSPGDDRDSDDTDGTNDGDGDDDD